jgi:hypothetical protein
MIAGGVDSIIDSLGALSRSMPVPLPCCGHEAEAHVRLCSECGRVLMHGAYCEQCNRRMPVVLACPGQQQRVAARLAAEAQRVAWQRELGYAG